MASSDHAEDGGYGSEFHPNPDRHEPHNTSDIRNPVSRNARCALRADTAWADRRAQTPDCDHTCGQSLAGGRGHPPGCGCANGDTLRPARGRGDLARPNFNIDVGPNGYAWWYVDGLSDCGTRAVSVIGFIGSVFSPWYRWSGRKCPQDNVCINVATYGPGGRFTMTDRGQTALRQTASRLQVGPSMMRWDGTDLVIEINEISSPPLINRIRGEIRVSPSAITSVELPLTPDGAHIWRPFAPSARISVDIDRKGWQWQGEGYFDANFGTRALEEDFSYWTWGRYPTQKGATCFYDATRLDGSELAAGFAFDTQGRARQIPLPAKKKFRRSLWAVKRETRSDPDFAPHQAMSMLDAPFYSRSAVTTKLDGEETTGVHEALDLTRFRSPLLKPMLAVRVPRRRKWSWD